MRQLESHKPLLLEITYQLWNRKHSSVLSIISNIAKDFYKIITSNSISQWNSHTSDSSTPQKYIEEFYRKYHITIDKEKMNNNVSSFFSSSSFNTLTTNSSFSSSSSSSNQPLKLTQKKAQSLFIKECQQSWKRRIIPNYQHLNQYLHLDIDINCKNKYGLTALMMACDRSNVDFVKFLISHGADINAATKDHHQTALTIAYKKLENRIVNYCYNPEYWNHEDKRIANERQKKAANIFSDDGSTLLLIL
jgi:hypothetical protein